MLVCKVVKLIMSFVRLYHSLAVLFIIKCSAFISILTIGKELQMLSSCYGTNINNANVVRNKPNYIHITEYPNDNYEHIFGYNDVDHQPSKLQLISALRIKETIRNKIPIDTVRFILIMISLCLHTNIFIYIYYSKDVV